MRHPLLPRRPLAALTLAITLTGCGMLPSNPPGPGFSEARFEALQVGTTRTGDVLATMGEPRRKITFERTATESWDYEGRDTWGYRAEFSVIFNLQGVMVSRLIKRFDPPSPSDR